MSLTVYIHQMTRTLQKLEVFVVGAEESNSLATLQSSLQKHLDMIPGLLSFEDPEVLENLDGPYYVTQQIARDLRRYDPRAPWTITFHSYERNSWELSYIRIHTRGPQVALPSDPHLKEPPSGWPLNGLICPICKQPQIDTPSGSSCPNGHGGEEGIKLTSKDVPRVDDYDGSGVPGYNLLW